MTKYRFITTSIYRYLLVLELTMWLTLKNQQIPTSIYHLTEILQIETSVANLAKLQ